MKNASNLKIKKVNLFAVLCAASVFIFSCQTGTKDDSSNSNRPEEIKPSYTYTPVDDSDLENMEAQQFTKVMGNGINLGNTFETNAANWMGFKASPTSYETGWGQPVTTKEIFQAYKAAGFDSVRIPIAWTSTMDWRNGDYKINDDFMARIKEVVNWALDSGLYVMINDHWDYGWWGLFGTDKTKAYKIFDEIWDQVGTEFKDYDYRLIFEAGNEEWGNRFNDEVKDDINDPETPQDNYGDLTLEQQYALITELAQHFVDKIRAQGSKNSKRFLLIPGYNTDFDHTTSDNYVMPEDSANSVQKLIVSVHYYAPAPYSLVSDPKNDWGFARTWGTEDEISAQNALFYKLKRFIDEGYGVIIGEYAVAMEQTEGLDTPDKGDDDVFIRKSNDKQWLTNILDNCDTYNYCPFLWDCNGYFKKTGNLGFTGDCADVAEVYKNRNYAAEKAGTSNGGKINYNPATKIYTSTKEILTVDGTSVKKTITLSKEVSVSEGQKITLSFHRPEIALNYAGHVMRIFDSNGTMLHGTDPNWCTSAEYPTAGDCIVTFNYKAVENCKMRTITIEISNPENTNTLQTQNLEINDVLLLLD